MVGIINIKPPIVGVPDFLWWFSTYTFILWPALIFFNKGIKIKPKAVAKRKPIIKANNDFVKVSILYNHFLFIVIIS